MLKGYRAKDMKMILVIIAMALSLGCSAQKKIDLGKLGLKEDIDSLIQGVPNIHKGALFDRTDMYSYGVSGNTVFYLGDFLPAHVELLCYKGKLAGYAFKMKTFADEQKLEQYLKANYKLVPAEQKARDVISTMYSDSNILIEFDAIEKASFEKGMRGYLNVRRLDFAAEYERLMKQ